jgi:uncharacterized protein DUF3352
MSDQLRPDEGTTIEDLPSNPTWTPATAPVPNQLTESAPVSGAPSGSRRGRAGLRWLVAIVGVILVVASSAVIVSFAASRTAVTSAAMGYAPADAVMYSEARLDLPGDQRQKLGEFLKTAVPGFDDQSQLDVKLNELYDRLTQAATNGKHTWSTEIAPWFGGTLGVAMSPPDLKALSQSTSVLGTVGADGSITETSGVMGGMSGMSGMSTLSGTLVIATITDRAKAEAWLGTVLDSASTNRSTYNGADLLTNADAGAGQFAIGVTDAVMLAGTEDAVKAAVDTGGKGTFASADDVSAALATIDGDNVAWSVIREKAYIEASLQGVEAASPGTLSKTQLDDTLLDIVPAWQSESVRFESDALSVSTANPEWSLGTETSNRVSSLASHVPANTIAYEEVHDVGATLKALIAKFRALPETKDAFQQFDQAIAVLGGSDTVFGWWGDVALDVAPVANGTIGAGFVIKPTDAAAATRFFTTLKSDLNLVGAGAGIKVSDADHNGTTITTVDFSGAGVSATDLPPGYSPEVSWAVNQDVAVIGYGHDFVAAVLDAGPGTSLADDARFKALVDRVGTENISLQFGDIAKIREYLEPLFQRTASAAEWTRYTQDIKPYLEHFDAVIGAVHKDGSLDRGSGQLTVR